MNIDRELGGRLKKEHALRQCIIANMLRHVQTTGTESSASLRKALSCAEQLEQLLGKRHGK